jgi:hypothetical protein
VVLMAQAEVEKVKPLKLDFWVIWVASSPVDVVGFALELMVLR